MKKEKTIEWTRTSCGSFVNYRTVRFSINNGEKGGWILLDYWLTGTDEEQVKIHMHPLLRSAKRHAELLSRKSGGTRV